MMAWVRFPALKQKPDQAQACNSNIEEAEIGAS